MMPPLIPAISARTLSVISGATMVAGGVARAGGVPDSTNMALGAPVVTSHPVERGLSASSLTDGLPYTLVHPQDAGLGAAFYYEVDLGSAQPLDHISLRQRNDRWDNNRFSRILVQLYEQPPSSEGGRVTWSALDRADGSYPEAAGVDVLRAGNGQGIFQGRVLRISSDNPVPHSPQLAEVEVYATRTPVWVSFRADEVPQPRQDPLQVSARPETLTFDFNILQPGRPPGQVLRWRLPGQRQDWQVTRDLTVEFPRPSTGNHTLEVQAAHSDGAWDATVFRVQLRILPPFTETLLFRTLLSLAALGVGAGIMRSLSRRRIQVLEAKSALSDERTRIARDMHDDVGARLAQLAVLQDIFAREYPQPADAQFSLEEMARVARQAVASLDEVVWTVDPQNDTVASTAEYLAQYATSYLSPLKIICRYDAPIDWPAVEVRAQARHELILAFKEALQNIVKHAGANEVLLTLRHDPGRFFIQVADNGCGLSLLDRSAGQDGLRNMSARLAGVGGACQAASRQPSGTTVTMTIPLLF